MKKSYFLALLAVGLLVGCTDAVQNDVQTPTSVEVDVEETPSYVIPVEQALASLEEVLVPINANREERGLKKLSITNRTECIVVNAKCLMTSQQMRRVQGIQQEGLLDTALYVVNFPNETGYAILSADNRIVDDVLVVTDNGSLSLEELTQIETSNVIRDSIGFWDIEDQDYYVGGATTSFPNTLVKDFYNLKVADKVLPIDPYINAYFEYEDWEDLYVIGPLVPVKWHQNPPFNKYAPRCPYGNHNKPAGCVAIALAQILAANQTITELNGVTIDWKSMNAGLVPAGNDCTKIAHWVDYIADKCNMKYGGNCSIGESDYGATTSRRAKIFLRNRPEYNHLKMIKNIETLEDETVELILNMLKAEKPKPVYIAALDPADEIGHAWVIDGYIEQRRYETARNKTTHEIISQGYKYRSMVHCNFGWGGRCDGYYTAGVFYLGVGRGPLDRTPVDSLSTSRLSDSTKYTKEFRAITYDLK